MGEREDVVGHGLWSYDNRDQIGYSQVDRWGDLHDPRHLPWEADCSSHFTTICSWAGCPDPNGHGYGGVMFTGTIKAWLPALARVEDLLPADPVVYGPGSGQHVAFVVRDAGTSDPLMCSHGQQAGPLLVRHSVERDAHFLPFTPLRLLTSDVPQPDKPKPTPIYPGDNVIRFVQVKDHAGQYFWDGAAGLANARTGEAADRIMSTQDVAFGKPLAGVAYDPSSANGRYRPLIYVDAAGDPTQGLAQLVKSLPGWAP